MDIGVLGSSRPREGTAEDAAAIEVGRELARRGARVVCGGYGGVMEAACRGASEAGGAALGVVLAGHGEPNRWVTETIVVADLPERLRRLRDIPDGWIFLPHGLGTMLELVWIAESVVKGDTPPRPLVLLGDFWRPVFESAFREASAAAGARALASSLRVVHSPAEAAATALGSA